MSSHIFYFTSFISIHSFQVIHFNKLHARTLKRISRDLHKRTCCCCSGSYKIWIQESPKSLPQELSYKHLQDTAFAISSCKDLFDRTLAGPPQDLARRTCTESCKDLLREFKRISTCLCTNSPHGPEFARACAAESTWTIMDIS